MTQGHGHHQTCITHPPTLVKSIRAIFFFMYVFFLFLFMWLSEPLSTGVLRHANEPSMSRCRRSEPSSTKSLSGSGALITGLRSVSGALITSLLRSYGASITSLLRTSSSPVGLADAPPSLFRSGLADPKKSWLRLLRNLHQHPCW